MSKVTQLVIVIALVQFVVIILIYNKLAAIEDGMAIAKVAQPVEFRRNDIARPERAAPVVSALPTEERLRQIIREELQDQLDGLSTAPPDEETVVAASSVDETELQYQRDLVLQQLDYHASIGRISDVEMQKLLTDIARLDPATRKEAMSALSRAMNTGQLEGRL